MDIKLTFLIIGVAFLVLLIGGGIIFFFVRKKGKNYKFLFYSRDGSKVTTINARLKTDPQNKSNKKFFFDGVDSPLDIRPPTKWINGVGYREIAFNDLGEYNYIGNRGIKREVKYIDNKGINRELYYEQNLEPEEKQITLFRYKENQRRFENPMDKWTALQMIGGFIMVLILIGGAIYMLTTVSGVVKDMGNIADQNTKLIKTQNSVTQAQLEITSQLASITAALTKDDNIVRRLD